MKIEILGYLGLGLILINYSLLILFNRVRILYMLNFVVGTILAIQSFMLNQMSLILFHGFTGGVSLFQLFRKSPPYICFREECERRLENKSRHLNA